MDAARRVDHALLRVRVHARRSEMVRAATSTRPAVALVDEQLRATVRHAAELSAQDLERAANAAIGFRQDSPVELDAPHAERVALCDQAQTAVGVRSRLTGHVERMAKDVVRHMHEYVARLEDRTEAESVSKHAFRSEAERRLSAMISLARSEMDVAVTPEQLDADPWKFNVRNGTLDLRSGTLRSHDEADLITKLAPVDFDQRARADLWLAFLEEVLGGAAYGDDTRAIG